MKHKLIIALCIGTVFGMLTGCTITTKGPSVSSGASFTVGGETKGSEQSSSDNGSASFDVNNGTVAMGNFRATATQTAPVAIVTAALTHSKSTLHNGQNVVMLVYDGHYTEPFSLENSAAQFNDLYQKVFKATDSPFTARIDQMAGSAYEQGTIGIGVHLSDCDLAMYVKEGMIAFVPGQDDNTVTNIETQMLTAFRAQNTNTVTMQQATEQTPQIQQEISMTDQSLSAVTEYASETPAQDNVTSDYGQAYTITVDNKRIGLDNFGTWKVNQTDETMCTVCPNDDTTVRYYDSACKVGDTEKFDSEGNVIATVYGVTPKMYTLNGDYGTEYLIVWEHDNAKYAEYFQVLPNVGTYMETDITAYNSDTDILDLVDLYSIDF